MVDRYGGFDALCGHVMLVEKDLGISTLHEFSTDRAGTDFEKKTPFPQNEVMQALEMHADEFAVRFCVGEILWGYDPMSEIVGPAINLADRLLIFNIACCVFTIIWTLEEKKFAPEDTFYPPLPQMTSNEPYTLFQNKKSTHPPALLRYDRLRKFQGELAWQYGQQYQKPQLNILVDADSFSFLNVLGEISHYFLPLELVTAVVVQTPVQKRFWAYADHLLEVGTYLHPKLVELCYEPTS